MSQPQLEVILLEGDDQNLGQGPEFSNYDLSCFKDAYEVPNANIHKEGIMVELKDHQFDDLLKPKIMEQLHLGVGVISVHYMNKGLTFQVTHNLSKEEPVLGAHKVFEEMSWPNSLGLWDGNSGGCYTEDYSNTLPIIVHGEYNDTCKVGKQSEYFLLYLLGKIYAASEVDIDEKKDGVAYAHNVTSSAVARAIVPSIGVALLHASNELSKMQIAYYDNKYTIAPKVGVKEFFIIGKPLEHDDRVGYGATTISSLLIWVFDPGKCQSCVKWTMDRNVYNVDGSFEKLKNVRSFEGDGETNVLAQVSKSIVVS